ncbi:hypothetical protein, partial [Curtobacterium sp. GD1]|uniref:hypothetical protein n=1 Tax=Curtobacterium sp. GD1 TaxID=2810612 RepID=UPI001E35164D
MGRASWPLPWCGRAGWSLALAALPGSGALAALRAGRSRRAGCAARWPRWLRCALAALAGCGPVAALPGRVTCRTTFPTSN